MEFAEIILVLQNLHDKFYSFNQHTTLLQLEARYYLFTFNMDYDYVIQNIGNVIFSSSTNNYKKVYCIIK